MITIKAYTVPKKTNNTSSGQTSGGGGGTTIVNTSDADNWFYYNDDYDAVCCRHNFYSVGSVTANGAPEEDIQRDDIVDNLDSTETNKALSANMGRVLKSLIDAITTTQGGQAVITIDWSNITNKPSTFAPSAHTHNISDVNNLANTISTQNSAISDMESDIDSHINNQNLHLTDSQRTKLGCMTRAQFAKLATLTNMIDIDTNSATITVNGSINTSNDVTARV